MEFLKIIFLSLAFAIGASARGADCPPGGEPGTLLKACARVTDANYSGSNLVSNILDGLRGLRVNLVQANLSFSSMNQASFRESLAQGLKLTGVRAHSLSLVGGNFSSAVFSGAQMEGCEFRGVFAVGADFSQANLKKCRFIRSYLVDSKWDGASLEGASFVDCIGAPSSTR